LNSNDSNSKEIQSVDALITALTEEDCRNYMNIVRSVNIPSAAFEPFCSWSPEKYTRNCIVENEKFELILLCWEQGQVTPIHDHGGEECWVKIIQGTFKETIYKMDDNGELTPIRTGNSAVGDISYMIDFMGFHRLENTDSQRSLSLHLYAKPIKNCQMFDEASKKLVRKELVYTTVFENPTILKE